MTQNKEINNIMKTFNISDKKSPCTTEELLDDSRKPSGLMISTVSGRCMEKENIFDGDYIMVDLDRFPLAEKGDIGLFYAKDFNMGVAVKKYMGVIFGFQYFSTCYTQEGLKAEGRTMGYMVSAKKIFGVVCACYAPDGTPRWVRDVSDRPSEIPQRRIVRYDNIAEL